MFYLATNLGSVWDAPASKCSVFLIRAEGCNTMFHVLNGHCGNKVLLTSVLHCIRVFSFLLSNTTSRLFLPWENLNPSLKNHVKTSRLFVPWEILVPSLKNHVKTSRLFVPWEILAPSLKNHVKTSRLFLFWEISAPSFKNHVKTSRLLLP